ncbi:MAG: glycosyltransferase family 2 protein [Nitrospirae bacterium]|nr:glycosyltransferase family 2 protein [Nitrospirota bacterium]
MKTAAVIPALNEEETLPKVLADISRDIVEEVVVVDNGSSDRTALIAAEWGATVLHESKRGYGYPCLRAVEYLKKDPPDIVVFVDANYSDYPAEIDKLVSPIEKGGYDMVLGSRILGECEEGALRPPVRFGNWLATRLIRLFYGFRFTDLGPFRAIRFDKLLALNVRDNLGWTLEMQIKAVKKKYRILEVPVTYRKGKGKSKLTGDLKGIFKVGYRILWNIFKYLFND